MKKKIFIMIFMFLMLINGVNAYECDANSDGKINSEDKYLIEKMVSGLVEKPEEGSKEFKAADCNNDGIISILDATGMQEKSTKVSCGTGEGMIIGIPRKIPELTSYAIRLIQVLVPVLLIVMGTIDLFKGITSGKDDEIKKGQQIFIKRLVIGIIIFFIIVIVKFLISIIASSNKTNIIECIDCFISENCENYNQSDKKDNSNNKTSESKNNKNTSTSKNNNKKVTSTNVSKTTIPKISNNLYVGDSRTVQMCEIYKLCEKHPYVAEGSQGYYWFANTAIPKINDKIKSKNYNIVILMGVNGVTTTGKDQANEYYKKISNLASSTWKKQNIIFISINPVVDGKSNAYTSGVNEFNKEMQKLIKNSKKSNLSYCDTNSKLKMSEIDSGDGLHYNKSGYQKIYNLIKKDCLKQK